MIEFLQYERLGGESVIVVVVVVVVVVALMLLFELAHVFCTCCRPCSLMEIAKSAMASWWQVQRPIRSWEPSTYHMKERRSITIFGRRSGPCGHT